LAWALDLYQLFSLGASLAAAFFLALAARRSIVFLAALAGALFVLFGPLSLAGFFLGVGAAALARRLLEGKK